MAEYTCVQCGTTHKAPPSVAVRRLYCSMACKREASATASAATCQQCGRAFLKPKPSASRVYCSRNCSAEALRATEVRCAAPGCKSVGRRSLCGMHYMRFKTYGSYDLPPISCKACGVALDRNAGPVGQRSFCDACNLGSNRERAKIRMRELRLADPESYNAKRRAYRLANRDKVLAQKRAWTDRNRESINDRSREKKRAARGTVLCSDCGAEIVGKAAKWCRPCARRHDSEWKTQWSREAYRSDPERYRAKGRVAANLRRARKLGAKSEPYSYMAIATRDKWICQICRKRVGRSYAHPDPRSGSLDHIVPISKGGDDVPANIQLAHFGCNASKNNRALPRGEQLRLIG